jgi:hypothetical protein
VVRTLRLGHVAGCIPSVGGATIEIFTMLIVPVRYGWVQEIRVVRLDRVRT